ncbi:hypothetical protein [Nocardia macrotermitis]|uniref:Uncharacterized protein n=1 Tax=Nocardia macrotermitis TaxID=2585198 RepID=A0A7K0D5T5_9NOCA|nr:hypothetical protein [Nocardia macrotermitis]MQY21098.1 hypothetical protein [Nocardia macrotermitis]
MPDYQGPCRITVTSVEALWPQRVAVRVGHQTHTFAAVLPGTPGASCSIDEDNWELLLQHWIDGQWRTNIRLIIEDWITEGNVQRQVIHSKDHDWPQDRAERNLVVTLERTIEVDHTRDRDRTRPTAAPRASASISDQTGPQQYSSPMRASSASRRTAARPTGPVVRPLGSDPGS